MQTTTTQALTISTALRVAVQSEVNRQLTKRYKRLYLWDAGGKTIITLDPFGRKFLNVETAPSGMYEHEASWLNVDIGVQLIGIKTQVDVTNVQTLNGLLTYAPDTVASVEVKSLPGVHVDPLTVFRSGNYFGANS